MEQRTTLETPQLSSSIRRKNNQMATLPKLRISHHHPQQLLQEPVTRNKGKRKVVDGSQKLNLAVKENAGYRKSFPFLANCFNIVFLFLFHLVFLIKNKWSKLKKNKVSFLSLWWMSEPSFYDDWLMDMVAGLLYIICIVYVVSMFSRYHFLMENWYNLDLMFI